MQKKHIVSLLLLLLIFIVILSGALILLRPGSGHTDASSSSKADASEETTSSEDTSSEPEESRPLAQDSDSQTIAGEASTLPAEVKIPYITITIPDRSTYPEILSLLSEKTGVSEEALTEEAASATALLPDPAAASACFFPLEGYILSGEYAIPEDGEGALTQIVKDSLQRIDDIKKSTDTAYTVHELLSIASIIEIESSRGGESEHDPEQMPMIASVIENRLSQSMQLQMDVTFQYGDETLTPHGASEEITSKYNTYDAPALPLGPICSPSEDAVSAALSPATSDALFFVFDEDGGYYFAADYEEHLENCRRIGLR